jgi:hypothetical protein
LDLLRRLDGGVIPNREPVLTNSDEIPVSLVNSLFLANQFPVHCRTGNLAQGTGIAAQMDPGTGWKASKWREISKSPCQIPWSAPRN